LHLRKRRGEKIRTKIALGGASKAQKGRAVKRASRVFYLPAPLVSPRGKQKQGRKGDPNAEKEFKT